METLRRKFEQRGCSNQLRRCCIFLDLASQVPCVCMQFKKNSSVALLLVKDTQWA